MSKKSGLSLEQLDRELGLMAQDLAAQAERIDGLEQTLKEFQAYIKSPAFKVAAAQAQTLEGRGLPPTRNMDATSGGPPIDFGMAVIALRDYMVTTGQQNRWFTAYEVATIGGIPSIARNIGHYMQRCWEGSIDVYDAQHSKHEFPFEPCGKYGATRAWAMKGMEFPKPLSRGQKVTMELLKKIQGTT